MTRPIRVLQVVGAMDRAGAETLIMNLYRCIDRSRIQFDFLVNATEECDYDEEIRSLGGRIFRVPRYAVANFIPYTHAVARFLREHPEHRIVHGHIGLPSPIYLGIAKRNGRLAIAHSHGTYGPLTLRRLVYQVSAHPVRHVADFFLACSRQAGVDRFGCRIVEEGPFHVLRNGVRVEDLRFSVERRAMVRREFGWGGVPVICHVGRLSPEKNHMFLLDVFSEVLRVLPDAKLLLVGRGPLEPELRSRVHNMGLEEQVLFLGIRGDVPAILSAADLFVFPSINEGLGLAAIEAQAAGLPCLCSTALPEEANCSNRYSALSLSAGPAAWARFAVSLLRAGQDNRSKVANQVRDAGYGIEASSSWLSELYERCGTG